MKNRPFNHVSENHMTILVSIAFLIALDVLLTRFLSVQTQFLRIGFGFLPIAVAGAAFGPLWGGACGAIGDILGMIIYPSGIYFPGFTLTAFLTGYVFGIILYRKNVSILKILIASTIVCLVLNLLLDTLWLNIMYGNGFFAVLPVRALKCLINIPIYTILIYVIWNRVISKIPQVKAAR